MVYAALTDQQLVELLELQEDRLSDLEKELLKRLSNYAVTAEVNSKPNVLYVDFEE